MLKGKTVVLGVTGSIAAYKAANLASLLVKSGADVRVIMTKNAVNFINPITFDSLTGHKCVVDMFDRDHEFSISHIALSDRADVICIAPASANIVGKMANGIADDMLSTTVMAAKCPIIISPAMNTKMYENPVLQDNLEKLRRHGRIIIPPKSGRLACGAVGSGKMPPADVIFWYILREIAKEKDFRGKKVLVTAGATREAIDPVRFISNRSTGKMGYAVARQAMLRGADVTLISGHAEAPVPPFVKTVKVETAGEMFDEVKKHAESSDFIIKAAAVADYTPEHMSDQKIKKGEDFLSIELTRTTDILKWLGERKKAGQVVCGFSMETENVLKNSSRKLGEKNADMIAANSLTEEGSGFGTDTNRLTLIGEAGVEELPMMSKEDAADVLLDRLVALYEKKA